MITENRREQSIITKENRRALVRAMLTDMNLSRVPLSGLTALYAAGGPKSKPITAQITVPRRRLRFGDAGPVEYITETVLFTRKERILA